MSATTLESPPISIALQSVAGLLRMSYEEFLERLNEDNKHSEWVDGKVIVHGPISRVESNLKLFVMGAMHSFVEDHDLGAMTYAPFQMRIGPNSSRIPEVAFIANENAHRIQMYSIEGPADLVVEIASPESRGRDRGDKFYEYEEGGVREYWLLDPERRIAEFYALGADGRYYLAALDAKGRFHSTVLAGFWLEVDWLWQDPSPTIWGVLKAWNL